MGNPLFGQDKPCPVRVGSRSVGKQLHTIHLRFNEWLLPPIIERAQTFSLSRR
jgi:hypothetical protein